MATPTPTPQHIGRYEVLAELGKGAMGVVYKARDPNIGRMVALKTMRLDVHGMEDSEILLRFKNEARAAGVLNHSNIVTIYDAGEFDGMFYIAMEYIEGITLQKVLNQQSVLPIEVVVDISRQICAGLDYAHAHRIIHRDVKPANIMIEADGRVKIMDFGIAKAEGTQLTTAGQVMGTPNYMSPEQVKGRPLDGRSDLWSFGVILYEMVTGEKPFTGQNVTTIIYKIVNENPIPPKELDASIHPGLSAVIQRALAKSPEQRYQKGADLVNHLANYKAIGVDTASLPADAGAAHVPKAGPETGAPAAAAAKPAPVGKQPPAPPAKPAPPGKPAADAAPPLPAAPAKPAPAAAPPVAAKEAPAKSSQSSPTLVAASHELGKIAGAAAPAKPSIPKLTPNQWLAIGAGVLAVLLVVIVLGVRHQQSVTAPTQTQVAESPAPAMQAPAAAPSAEQPAETAAEPVNEAPKPKAKAPAKPAPAAAEAAQPASPAPVNGTLRLVSNPPGAKVEIDGWPDAKWVTPFVSPNLNGGKHKIVFKKSGYADETRIVDVSPGKEVAVEATLSVTALPGHIQVVSDPAGATILLDGRETGKQTPATLDVAKGEHQVALRKLGYREIAIKASVAEGQTFHISEVLKGGAAGGSNPFGKLFGGGIPEGMGALQVKTKPKGATVTVNGEAAPKTTPFKLPLNPGSYQVVISMDGYKPSTQSIAVEKGKTANIEIELQK